MTEDNQTQAAHSSAGPRNSNPAGSSGGGRRRGGGRGASQQMNRTDHRRNEGRSEVEYRGSRGRGGRRGRGNERSDRNNPTTQMTNATSGEGGQPPGTGLDGTGTSSDHPTGDAIKTEGEAAASKQLVAPATDEPDDGEVCFICASKVEHTSVAPCNHRTCHICALRLRALYKTKACAHCRVCRNLEQFRLAFN